MNKLRYWSSSWQFLLLLFRSLNKPKTITVIIIWIGAFLDFAMLPTSSCQKITMAPKSPIWVGGVCLCMCKDWREWLGGNLTSCTEACWKRGIRGLVLGISMWICRNREREREGKKNSEANRQVRKLIEANTDGRMNWQRDRTVSGLASLIEGRWRRRAVVKGSEMGLATALLNAFACVVHAGPWLHHFRIVCPTDGWDRQTDTSEEVDVGGRRLGSQLKRSRKGSWLGSERVCMCGLWSCQQFLTTVGVKLSFSSFINSVALTSVTFGCSTKDSGLILGMSMWIWQSHGEKKSS